MSSSLPTTAYVIAGRETGNAGNSVAPVSRKNAVGNTFELGRDVGSNFLVLRDASSSNARTDMVSGMWV